MMGVIVAVAAPAIFAMSGFAIDYTAASRARTRVQNAADTGALAGAASLRLANNTSAAAASIAESQAKTSAMPLANVSATATVTAGDVFIEVGADVPTTVMKMFGTANVHVAARARAKVVGSTPTCVLVLDPSVKGAFDIDQASISANGCGVYSNSTASTSMSLDKGATLAAAIACSSGGAVASGGASYNPSAQTDCPARVDPLLDRPAPTVGACTTSGLKLIVATILAPGVYCGGLEVKDNVAVMFLPGTYIVKDGPLKLNGNAVMTGNGVSFFLTGTNATLDINGQAAMDLSAPAFGPMAGILFFEDRAAPLGNTHKLNSRNAPNLLGTVYLSRGTLEVGAKGGYATTGAGLAQNSAWTVIVARQLSINDKINVVMNTNYGATVVQPPAGVAPNGQVRLVQ